MTSTNTLVVNSERLWATIERSAEIGRFRGTGLRRLALSSEDADMRDIFVGWGARGRLCRRDRSGRQHLRAPRLPSAATSTRRSAAANTTACSVSCADWRRSER
jgi:hypothetical protein